MIKYPYSVKSVKTLETHDGQALTAVLYHGSKKVGSIEDGGTGGGIWPHFLTRAENDAFAVWVTSLGDAHYPASKGMDAMTFPHNNESALEMLLDEYDRVKSDARMDRAAKTKLIYREAADSQDSYRVADLSDPVRALPLPSIVALYQQKASWFAKASDVWVIGAGWIPISAI